MNPLRLKPLKEFVPSLYRQQKTGLFRNTMIAPATHEPIGPPLRTMVQSLRADRGFSLYSAW